MAKMVTLPQIFQLWTLQHCLILNKNLTCHNKLTSKSDYFVATFQPEQNKKRIFVVAR